MNEELSPKKAEMQPGRRNFIRVAGTLAVGIGAGAAIPILGNRLLGLSDNDRQIRFPIPSRDGLEEVILPIDKSGERVKVPIWMSSDAKKFIEKNGQIGFDTYTGMLTVIGMTTKGDREILIKSSDDVKPIKEIRVVVSSDKTTLSFYFLKADLKTGFSVLVNRWNTGELVPSSYKL